MKSRATRISAKARRVAPQRRKQPRQQRAQATVDALLTSAAQLLHEHGYAALTTNHIAARAGISIGSLYQYFPNKEALCHALAQRHFQRYVDAYLARQQEVSTLPIEAQVRALLALSFEIAREDPAMAKNLYAELPRVGGMDPMQDMREAMEAAMAQRFRELPPGLRPRQPEMAAFVVTVASSALIGDAVLRRPQWLRLKAYEDQVAELLLGYYQRLGWLD